MFIDTKVRERERERESERERAREDEIFCENIKSM